MYNRSCTPGHVRSWSCEHHLQTGPFRAKLIEMLDNFLTELPSIERQEHQLTKAQLDDLRGEAAKAAGLKLPPRVADFVDWGSVVDFLAVDDRVDQVDWAAPGERSATALLAHFLNTKLALYHQQRSNPLADGLSNLSPYLHFGMSPLRLWHGVYLTYTTYNAFAGQISAQRIVLEVVQATQQYIDELFTKSPQTGPQKFLDQLVIRREVAENFCYYSEGVRCSGRRCSFSN